MSPPDKPRSNHPCGLSEDPMTGERTDGTPVAVLGAGQGGQQGEGDERACMDRSAAARKYLRPSRDSPEHSAGFWHPFVSSEEWLGVSDKEFDQRLVQLIR